MRGSTPNCAAVAADCTAMSASCSAVGSGFTAQSPYTRTRSSSAIRNTDETIFAPGLVLMISKDGRMVCVVLAVLLVVWVDDAGLGDVVPQLDGPGPDAVLVPQQDEVGDAAGEDRLGGRDDPRLIALGQHDPLLLDAGAGQQLELEHHRR